MRLSVLLMLLGIKLRWSAWRDANFRKKIKRINRIVVIRTEDGGQARSYVFSDDSVRSQRGVHPRATAQLVWVDAGIAISAMLSANPLDSFSAIGRGDLVIEGNLQDALWFSDLVQ